ncbi:MAG: transglutaminase-like domain-containing protein [Opitutaceae bacterium]
MKPTSSEASLREALLTLLDDPAPAVRRALLAHFAADPLESARLLKDLAGGSNRLLAWHARSYLEELKLADPVGDFRDFIRSLKYELETGSMLMARTVYPTLDVAACSDQLDRLAARCRELIAEPCSAREKCRVINRVLYHDHGFHGNIEHYTDPENSFLHRVLERHKGIPISLCLVYLLVAQRLGLTLEPVAPPGHFVLGCFSDDAPFYIDAFDGGVLRSTDELCARLAQQQIPVKAADLAPSSIREMLCRCCRNLVNHYARAGDFDRSRLFAGFVEEFEATYARNSG